MTDATGFVGAVARVGSGGSAIDSEVVRELLERRRRDDPLETLTPRERDVLTPMAEGLTNQGIAERPVVTDKAVERHVTSIFSKRVIDAGTDRAPTGPRGADVPARHLTPGHYLQGRGSAGARAEGCPA